MTSTPWKWDVTIYDHPGWRTLSNNHQVLRVLPDGRLVCQIWSTPAGLVASDYYKEQLDDRALVSEDGGRSWCDFDGPVRPPRIAELSDGTWVQVQSSDLVTPPEERKAQLEAEGLGHLWSPTTWYQYRLWPASKEEELRQQGYLVHKGKENIIATATGFTVRISRDQGTTWTQREIEEFPWNAKTCGFFRDPLVLDNDVIVGAGWGQLNPERKPLDGHHYTSYCIRSEDRGATWELIPVGHDPDGPHSFDECVLQQLPTGRILMLIRHQGPDDDRHIQTAYSDDAGKTWSPTQPTPMWGYPPFPLLLRSGKLLCVYTHRRAPFGIRCCISHDAGETWDIDNEIIIRDDAVNGGISYPSAAQLSDGSIFCYYATNKPDGDGTRMYAAGSCFSEDFVRPNRWSC